MNNPTKEQIALAGVNDAIARLPEADQKMVDAVLKGIHDACVKHNPDDTHVALAAAKIGLELAIRNAGGIKL